MPNNPKEIGDKLAAVLQAWKDLRPTKSFAGMTLVQFRPRSNRAWMRAMRLTR